MSYKRFLQLKETKLHYPEYLKHYERLYLPIINDQIKTIVQARKLALLMNMRVYISSMEDFEMKVMKHIMKNHLLVCEVVKWVNLSSQLNEYF